MTVKLRKLIITAAESAQDGGAEYEFEAYKLETGAVVVLGEQTNDEWFESTDDVQAHGNATIVRIEPTEEIEDWGAETIIESIEGSGKEFGKDAVPASVWELCEKLKGAVNGNS